MTERYLPMEAALLKPGDKFHLVMAGTNIACPATVKDCWVPSANPDTVRIHIEVPRYWNGGQVPVQLEVERWEPTTT